MEQERRVLASRVSPTRFWLPGAISATVYRRGWEDEATSRAVNALPWDPPPGMVKRQCPECRYFFVAATETKLCPDCAMPRRNIRA